MRAVRAETIVRAQRAIARAKWPLKLIVRRYEVSWYKTSSGRALWICALLVGLCSCLFPYVRGYGTVLFQLLAFGSLDLVGMASSPAFAEAHLGYVWVLAVITSVAVFLIPGAAIYFLARRRAPGLTGLFLGVWCAFYIGSLLVLFPATDGP